MSDDRASRSPRAIDLLLFVLLFGSLWGATEALLGGMLHRLLPPVWPGRILIVFAFAWMAYAVRTTNRAWLPVGMALVAAPLKLVTAAVYALPAVAPEVLNPALAILAEGASFAAVAMVLGRRGRSEPWRLALVGAMAGGLQVLVWIGLVHWAGTAWYPPAETLEALGAKLPPPWIGSAAAIADLLRASLPLGVLGGALGALLVAALPKPGTVVLRPARAMAVIGLCLTISLIAPWLP